MKRYVSFSQAIRASLAFSILLLAPSAFAQSLEIAPIIDHTEPIVVDGKAFQVMDSLPITVNRDQLEGSAIKHSKVSADGRYKLLKILPTVTKSRKEAKEPTPHQLYRLGVALDQETNKEINVALPIRFEP